MKKALAVAILLAGLMHAITPAQQVPPDALKFFKNYFVTGSYVVGGVGMRGKGVGGLATGTIPMVGAPEGADLVAAFLYWQVVTKDQTGDLGAARATFGPWSATPPAVPITPFSGIALSTADGPLGKVLGAGQPPCWSGGGGTGTGGAYRTFTYRTDVLRFLHIDEATGKFTVNGYYQVQLPDGDGVTALGASLVVIYRDTNPAQPLKSIVLYDGTYTMDQSSQGMFQRLAGFYDGTAAGKLTHIVGSGQANKSEILRFNGTAIDTNPFKSVLGGNWDNPTYSLSSGLPTEVTTSVDHEGFSAFDCLTWAAIVYETPVKDTDGDGLLDAWETSPPPVDPFGQPLPDLAAMGATPDHQDVFVEVGYMKTGDTSYGGVGKPAHSHLPTPAAIDLIGDAFGKAPVANPDGSTGIRLHVDVGPDYPQCAPDEMVDGTCAGPSFPPCTPEEVAKHTCWSTDYVVPANLARGGEWLDESITTPACDRGSDEPLWKCQFQQHPGTVGWKTGFQYIKDQILSGPPADPADPITGEDPCDVPGNTCVRRFDRNRSDAFHYAFFAHAVGMPKSKNACLDASQPGIPVEKPDEGGTCPAPLIENPLFFTPRTNSGIGDFPGRDVLVTLGAFSDRYGRPGGTDFMVASTWFHELGHNMDLRHGAWQDTDLKVRPGPNCVPTYLSAMNYLYQLRGLLDDSGKPHLDFAGAAGTGPFDGLDEAGGSDRSLPWGPQYRIGWYAPLKDSYFVDPATGQPRTTVAGRHCDGSPLGENDVPMVRVDARTATGIIDWNANGTQDGYTLQDLNFNGRKDPAGSTPELPQSFDDWANIRLNQIGAARSVGAPFLDELGRKSFGPLSADLARADWARADWARADWARADWARADWARADWGDLSQGDLGRYGMARADWARADWARADWARADWARADWGRGDEGRADYGGGDLFINDPYNAGGELDFETATLLANTPPYEFNACLGSATACGEGSGVLATWKATNEGNELRYILYRVKGTLLAPEQTWTPVATLAAEPGRIDYSYFDSGFLERDADYLYFAVAVYNRTFEGSTFQVQSEPSNLAAVRGPNHSPAAVADAYETNEDTVLTQGTLGGVLSNDADVDGDSLTAVLAAAPSHGIVALGADGSFTYTPAGDYNGTDSFSYKASDGELDSAAVSVVITVKPVNDTPVGTGLTVTVAEDTPTTITLSGTDVDSGTLTYLVTALPDHGTLAGSAPNLTYTPAPNYNGPDAFTFTVSDGSATSAAATVTIDVTAVNDAPVAADDTYGMPSAGGVLNVAARGVLANDTDLDSPTLTAVLASRPSGTLVWGGDGSFTYTASPLVTGSVTFTYRARDGSGAESNLATVRIAAYALYGIQNVPPATIVKTKAGSSIPMKWQFRDGLVLVDSSAVTHTVTVRGPLGSPSETVRTVSNTDPGSSTFRYDGLTSTWYFNLQTKDASGVAYAPGSYEITITPAQPGYMASPTFGLTLTK
jgi:VCBS repeat-containing protein